MPQNQIYLVSGASRGIGKGIVRALLQQQATTVIAAIRDVSEKSCACLKAFPTCNDSRLIIVKIDSANHSDAAEAIITLQGEHDIESLDVVIACAGIGHSGTSVMQTTTDSIIEHFIVNTLGPVTLLQATAPLLQRSKSGRAKFVAISSLVGSIAGIELLECLPSVVSPYGGSKAALNWFMRRVHFEEEWLITFALHPGVVATDFIAGEKSLPDDGSSAVHPISVEESVHGILERIGSATRETSGKFKSYDDNDLPW